MRSTFKVNILIPVLLVVLVAGLIPAAAQTAPQESLPSVDKILEKYVGALGGKAAFKKLTSRVSKGTRELEQTSSRGSYEVYEKAPNKELTITDGPNSGGGRAAFNGTVGWQDTRQNGVRYVFGAQLTAMKRDADFYREIKLKETYPMMVVKGKESVNGHDAYVVEATPADGPPELMYFDVDSGLLVLRQTQVQAQGPSGPLVVMVKMNFEDYREVDGIKLPFVIRGPGIVIRFAEVKHNVPIEDTKFDHPKTLTSTVTDELGVTIETLSSSDDDEKIEAAYKLGEMRNRAVPAIPFLIERLLHESSGIGRIGRDKLKYLPDVKYVLDGNKVSDVKHVLDTGSKVGVEDAVQQVVAGALAKIGKPALKPLRETLSNERPSTVHWAAVAIVKMNDPAATKVVTDLVGDEALQERHELVDALGYSKDLALVPILITALQDKDKEVRSAAASALGGMTGQELGGDPGKWQTWWDERKR